MGIKFLCPNGHKLNVKAFLAGRRGICPQCEARFRIPMESGGTAEPIHKGDRAGDETRLTAAMQDEASAPGSPEAAADLPAIKPAASPLGTLPTDAVAANFVAPVAQAANVAAPVAGVRAVAPSAAADPLAENPDAVWYVRPRSGGQYGPAGGEIMRTWIDEGRVAGDSLVWCEGWPDWRVAATVFRQLGASAPLASTAVFTNGVAIGVPVGAAAIPEGVVPAANGPRAVAQPVTASALDTPFPATRTASAPPSHRAMARRNSKSMTAVLVMVLALVAIALAGVFVWVLFGQDSPAPEEALRPASAQIIVAFQPPVRHIECL